MDNAPKKISFGFSKQLKKSVSKPVEEKKQFIDCLEGKSIKIKDEEVFEEKKPLVIPLRERSTTASVLARIARGEVDLSTEDEKVDTSQVTATEPPKNETLENMAEREILENLKKDSILKSSKSNLVLPVTNVTNFTEVESTLDDYENIPVGDFGMAMLRGMGWAPGMGMGKHGKSSNLVIPEMRPRGMGLGADKASATPKKDKKNIKEITSNSTEDAVKNVLRKNENESNQKSSKDGNNSSKYDREKHKESNSNSDKYDHETHKEGNNRKRDHDRHEESDNSSKHDHQRHKESSKHDYERHKESSSNRDTPKSYSRESETSSRRHESDYSKRKHQSSSNRYDEREGRNSRHTKYSSRGSPTDDRDRKWKKGRDRSSSRD